jgi:hypothetical protein
MPLLFVNKYISRKDISKIPYYPEYKATPPKLCFLEKRDRPDLRFSRIIMTDHSGQAVEDTKSLRQLKH